jgi:hypothetical protein
LRKLAHSSIEHDEQLLREHRTALSGLTSVQILAREIVFATARSVEKTLDRSFRRGAAQPIGLVSSGGLDGEAPGVCAKAPIGDKAIASPA